MKNFILLSLTILFASCEKNQSQMKTADEENLQELETAIYDMVDTLTCADAEIWHYVAVGSKACGGPRTYVAYSEDLDTAGFLNLVHKYNESEKAFNEKYNVISDCMHMLPPRDVTCDNGKPVLVY